MNELRSDVHCTNCGGEFVAVLDMDLNGDHEITCPHCQHIHYRVVRDGVVTEQRWRSSSQQVFQATTFITQTTTTTNLVFGPSTSGTTTSFLRASWLNTLTIS